MFTKLIGAFVKKKEDAPFTVDFLDLESIKDAHTPGALQKLDRFASFQERVAPWMLATFGKEIARDTVERNHRFLEEALELVQSLGCTESEAEQLVKYVYGRKIGETPQEIGGVMVTLAALCLAAREDMHECGEAELKRIWLMVEKIRAKQAAKPKHSPLPEAPAVADKHKRIDVHILLDLVFLAARGENIDPDLCASVEEIIAEYDYKDATREDIMALYGAALKPIPQKHIEALELARETFKIYEAHHADNPLKASANAVLAGIMEEALSGTSACPHDALQTLAQYIPGPGDTPPPPTLGAGEWVKVDSENYQLQPHRFYKFTEDPKETYIWEPKP